MSMTDEEWDTEYARVLGDFTAATQIETGCFFLINVNNPEWPAYPVLNEPVFEAEFRTRMDSDTHPNDTLVIIGPWPPVTPAPEP